MFSSMDEEFYQDYSKEPEPVAIPPRADAASSAMKSSSAASYPSSSGVVQSPSELAVPTYYLPSPTSSHEVPTATLLQEHGEHGQDQEAQSAPGSSAVLSDSGIAMSSPTELPVPTETLQAVQAVRVSEEGDEPHVVPLTEVPAPEEPGSPFLSDSMPIHSPEMPGQTEMPTPSMEDLKAPEPPEPVPGVPEAQNSSQEVSRGLMDSAPASSTTARRYTARDLIFRKGQLWQDSCLRRRHNLQAAKQAIKRRKMAAAAERLLQLPGEIRPNHRELTFEDGPLGFEIEGAGVVAIEPQGQADCLGLRVGDELLAVGGDAIPAPPAEDSPEDADERVKDLIWKWIEIEPRPVSLHFSAGKQEPRAPVLFWALVVILIGLVGFCFFKAVAASSAMKPRSAASYLSSGVVQSPSELPLATYYLPSPGREELEGTTTAPTMVATLQVMCPLKNGPCRRYIIN